MAGFVHLHAHSGYSFLDGCAQPDELVARAAALEQDALALTDWNGLYGAPAFAAACRARGVRPLFGAEIAVPGLGHLTLLVKDRAGWRSLCHLLTDAQLAGEKGRSPVAWATLARHTAGLLCLTGCRHGALAGPLRRGDEDAAWSAARRLLDLFGDGVWIEIARNRVEGELPLGRALAGIARRLGLGVVATANAHYCRPEDAPVADALACIRAGTTLAAARHLRPNGRYHLASAAEMAERFRDLPEALANARAVAGRCTFDLAFGRHRFPAIPLPHGRSPDEELRARCLAGLAERYAGATAGRRREAAARLDHELGVVARLGLAGYFLVVHDLVRVAHARGIPCQGRGSAAGSLIAYALRIARVEPLAQGLLFARFLNEERADALPDIDLDFGAARREEAIRYLYDTYGRAATGMAITFQQYHERGAVRDVGGVLGLPRPALDALGARLRRRLDPDLPAAIDAVAGAGAATRAPWSLLVALVPRLVGLPRHTGIHNGGVVVVAGALADYCPLERATMAGRQVVQWDKEGLETVGLAKIDVLGLQALDLVAEAARLVGDGRGGPYPLDAIPLDDPAVYALLRAGDTVGCFQVESRAQQALLPVLRPRRLDDITVAISLIRPGPVTAGVVQPFLRRRRGEEPVTYAHPLLEPVLRETHGVMLYQEQVLQVAIAFAGFGEGEADELRRAMGSKRSAARMAALAERFLAGAAANGVDEATAREVYGQVSAFSGYGFVKAHSASFALLAYETLWFRAHHPVQFHCARLRAQPGGFYDPRVLVGDARRHGIAVLGPDLDRSTYQPTVEAGAVRLGLRLVRGLADETGPALVAERARGGPFRDLADLCRRGRPFLAPAAVEALILAGACDGWGEGRRRLLWRLPAAWRAATGLPLPVATPGLTPQTPLEALAGEEWATGIPVGGHPVALLRPALTAAGILPLGELARVPAGRRVTVAGRLAVLQRPPTAKGMAFVTLEDETALGALVLDPEVDRRDRAHLHAPLVVAEGRVERRRGVVSLRVTGVRAWLPPPATPAADGDQPGASCVPGAPERSSRP